VAGLKKMLGSVAEQTALALGDLSKKVSTLAQVFLPNIATQHYYTTVLHNSTTQHRTLYCI
jgi:hypothetical protein